jgi:hypothetical protein
MSYEPAEDGGLAPQAAIRPSRVQAGACPGRFIFHSDNSTRIAEVPPLSPCRAHPGSSRGPRLGGFTIHERRTESPSLSERYSPIRFPSEAGAPAGSSSKAERGEFESHGCRRALVSSEAGRPARSLSMEARQGIEPCHNSFAGCHQHQLDACREYPPWDSNPDARCLRPVALPIGLEGHGADTGNRTRDLTSAR